ncbi:MAG: hypothetical protein LC107_00965 [Chitinophagales bacterium]|nr:hypothetical protein [Chitinophagales bacterium]
MMSKFEITQDQYKAIMSKNPSFYNSRFKVVKGDSYIEKEAAQMIKKRSKGEINRPLTFIGF